MNDMPYLAREGWGEEDGSMIHLESEAGVMQSEHGDWVVLNLEDEEVSPPFQDPRAAMDWFERKYAENPRHISEW